MTLDSELPSLGDLESLFVNNADLDTIRAHLNRFNPIKTMGMERMEIRHSAILGWLLDPQETHGLGDTFLKAFLSQALCGHQASMKPTALDVSQADMTDAEIRREWRNIDLLVLSPRNGWIFIIENKFDSKQHSNQLKRYRELVNSAFMGSSTYVAVRGIFLTLSDERPEDGSYASIEYSAVCQLLKQIAFSGRLPLTAEVEIFLKHYLDVILEATGMSQEQKKMEKLARELYRVHRRALDFIVGHGRSTDFLFACDAVFGANHKYLDFFECEAQNFVFSDSDSKNNNISFLPKSWFDALGGRDFHWHGCEGWWAEYPVIMWLQLTSNNNGGGGQVRLFAEVGPLNDHDFRRNLIEAIKGVTASQGLLKIGFQNGATDKGKRYSKFFKKNFFSVEDVHDHDQISNAIKKALNCFKDEIEAVSKVLPQFLANGQKEAAR